MPKLVSEDEKRVPLNCLVSPETRRWLRGQGGSQGELIDRAVAALRMQEAQGRVVAETGEPRKALALSPPVVDGMLNQGRGNQDPKVPMWKQVKLPHD